MSDDTDALALALAPKSDQISADYLILGPIDVTITGRKVRPEDEQSITVFVDGGHPVWRPCKTVARCLVHICGKEWTGRRVRLYRDPGVKWGGAAVGGVRVSHISGIDRPVEIGVTITRGKHGSVVIHPLPDADPLPTFDPSKIVRAFVAVGVDANTLGEVTPDRVDFLRGALAAIKAGTPAAEALERT